MKSKSAIRIAYKMGNTLKLVLRHVNFNALGLMTTGRILQGGTKLIWIIR